MLTSDEVRSYKEQGYVIVQSVFSSDEVRMMKEEADAVFRLDRPEVIRAPDGEPRVAHAISEYSDVFARVLHHPKLLDPVTQIMGEPYYCHQYKVVTKKPFGRNNLPWHTDYSTWEEGDGMPEALAITVGVFLEQVTEFNGPLLFIPGSHLEANIQFHRTILPGKTDETVLVSEASLRELIDRHGIVSPKGPAGTVIMFHSRIVHGSSPNMTPIWRHILYMSPNPLRNKIRRPSRSAYVASTDFTPLVPNPQLWQGTQSTVVEA